MNTLSIIRDHSGRVYHFVQSLLLLSVACSALAAGAGGMQTLAVGSASGSAAALAMIGLIYMRRTVVYKLRHAAVAEAEVQKLLTTDALTGALTRRAFLESVKQRLGGLRDKRQAILVLIDLDYFKQLNDTFGHHFGDVVLEHFCSIAAREFPGCSVGRLGGDEFAVLAPHGDVQTIRAAVERVLHSLREGKQHDGNCIPLSASVGIAIAPLHASQASDLMLLADLALYESKVAGRGRATVFDENMLSDKRFRRLVERELRAAVYLDQLELHYQPVIDADGATFALEGLIRWRHPVRGTISPAEFIPIAERSSLIDTIGEWVFRKACADVGRFPGCRISINVSGEQLKRDDLVRMVERTLTESGCTANQFVLEVTETVATAATPEILQRLETLRGMGFRIALDDFGTGHCGFNYLKMLPIDSIKIDRSYINTLRSDPVAQVFVAALTQIARIRDITVVAEGVETEEEFALARAAGCTRFQGYLISRPQPAENLKSLVFDLSQPALALTA